MSIVPPDKQSDYNNIQEGLKEGNRVVYDKQDKRFQYMSTAAAKAVTKFDPQHYTSDLTEVKQAIEQFIQENEIDKTTAQNIQNALNTKNESAQKNKFTQLFSKAKLETASEDGADLKNTVHMTAQKRLGQNAPTTTDAEKQKPTTEATPLTKRATASDRASDLKGPSSPKEEVFEPSSPDTLSALPPAEEIPLPPGDIPAPPNGLSVIHKQLTEEADKLPKFNGEPNRPRMKRNLDIGNANHIRDMDSNEKIALSEEIKLYRMGREAKQPATEGATDETTVIMEKKGLKQLVESAEAVIKKHKKIERDQEKLRLEGTKLRGTHIQLTYTLATANSCLSNDKPYVTKTAEKEPKTLTFYPKAAIENMGIPDEYYTQNKIPKPLSLEWKIKDLKEQKREIAKEIVKNNENSWQLDRDLENVEKEGLEMFEKPIKGGYQEFVTVTKQKRNNLDTWRRREEDLAPSQASSGERRISDLNAEEKQARLTAALNDPKNAPLKDHYELYTQSMGDTQAQMINNPEQFGRRTQLEK